MCEWVMSHVQMSHVSCVNESCLTCAWVMSRVWMSHVSYVNESCLICEWVKSHMWMSHVSHVSESCLTCKWVMSHMCMCQVSHVNESCLTCKWVMSHMWVSHVSHVNASSRMHTWNADQSESDQEDAVKTNLMTSATSLENLLSTGFFWCVPFSLTHMGWLRLVGSLRLWVSFTKEPYKADDSLQKRPIIFRSLLIIAWKSTFDRFFLTCSFQFDT